MASVLFEWDFNEFNNLVKGSDKDDGVQLSLKYAKKEWKILESGCGSGRVVKYFQDKGYNIEGVELHKETVEKVNALYPELKVWREDATKVSRPDDSYDMVLSYGVIEHFIEGPTAILKEMLRLMKPGGIAIITVPSVNHVRAKKYKKGPGDLYYKWPSAEKFFEYRLLPEEFESTITGAGYKIVESLPISHMDGMYHEKLAEIKYANTQFYPSDECIRLNEEYKKIPFYHNHMHAIVATK